MPPNDQIAATAFGIAFIVVSVLIAFFLPRPTPFQLGVFRIVLSLAAAGVAAAMPGFVGLAFNPAAMIAIQAGGAMAVFVIVYFFNPAGPEVSSLTVEDRAIMAFHRLLINGGLVGQDPNYLPTALRVSREKLQALYDKLCS